MTPSGIELVTFRLVAQCRYEIVNSQNTVELHLFGRRLSESPIIGSVWLCR